MSEDARAGKPPVAQVIVSPPPGRKIVFLGDLVDRGPEIPQVLRLVMDMVRQGTALCLPGNHEMKLLRKLRGKNVQITHGLERSIEQLDKEPKEFLREVEQFPRRAGRTLCAGRWEAAWSPTRG